MTSKYFDKELHSDGFPEDQAALYMEDLWGTLGKELTNSYRLQKLVKWKRTMNWFVGRASKKEELGDILTGMIADKEAQKSLWSPWFLFKTLVLPQYELGSEGLIDEYLTGIEAVFLDLDGTIYLGDQLIDGALEFLDRLENKGIKRFFLSII